MPLNRLPRFRRVPQVRRITLTDRDRAILKLVHRHRFLRSSHLGDLVGGSHQHLLRRLQLLYHHGYLERPHSQIDYFGAGGSRAIAYGLGNKGAACLKRDLKLPFHRHDWGAKSRSAGRLFLEHALLVSDIMVAVELACRRTGRVRLLAGDEVPLPEAARKMRDAFRWKVALGTGESLGVVPDRVFCLELVGESPTPTRAFFFLEADRGTMPVLRETLSNSSVLRKLIAYEATWTQNLHRTRFGFNRFRVLTITSSQERVGTMVEATRQLQRGKGLFLLTDIESFLAARNPLELPLTTARTGELESLLDSLSTGQRLLKC